MARRETGSEALRERQEMKARQVQQCPEQPEQELAALAPAVLQQRLALAEPSWCPVPVQSELAQARVLPGQEPFETAPLPVF